MQVSTCKNKENFVLSNIGKQGGRLQHSNTVWYKSCENVVNKISSDINLFGDREITLILENSCQNMASKTNYGIYPYIERMRLELRALLSHLNIFLMTCFAVFSLNTEELYYSLLLNFIKLVFWSTALNFFVRNKSLKGLLIV